MKYSERGIKTKFILMISVFVLVFIGSFGVGWYPVPIWQIPKILLSRLVHVNPTWANEMETVVLQIRLPRILAAVLIGAALSTAGAVYQGLFRNPMVSPEVLGASSGAGFGAALGIIMAAGYFRITVYSFVFGLIAVTLTYTISARSKLNRTLSLVLAGIMIGSIFSSLISYIKLVADPLNDLPAITYWLMGSLASIRQRDIYFVSIPMLLGLIPLILLRWRINILTMGDEEAKTMGVDTGLLRLVTIGCATLITAASVSVSGMIGWIGLVIPHFARLIVGYDYKVLIPTSILLGSTYLLIVDDIARILTTAEVPLGILTSLVGAPVFILLLLREDIVR